MKRLGIFLGFTPKQLVPHEGISRLIGFIAKGAAQSKDISVTIAGPSWLREEIIALLDDAEIPRSSIKIITTRSQPYIVRIWRWRDRLRRAPRRQSSFPAHLKRLGKWLLSIGAWWAATPSTILFVVGGLLLAALSALAILPAIAAGALLTATFAVRRGVAYLSRRSIARKIVGRYRAARKRVVASIPMVDRVREAELSRLVRMLNRRKIVDVWYVPSMFWPEVAGLDGKVVMAAPDIVFYEHPTQYIGSDWDATLERISASLAAADHLISYSEYVKQRHIVERQRVPAEKVSVIRHGIVDMRAIEGQNNSRNAALDIVHSYLETKKGVLPEYLDGFRFDDVQFLFYSSQVRPHKNIEGLISVYAKILREHYRPIKLVLTAGIGDVERIMSFIDDRGLQRDVISLYSVPNPVLAALYRLAALSVTPTMFEGGFPFTFSEAYSVGTPSIMSRIPAVTEIIRDEKLLDLMTFDPRDRREMLQKILWGLDNRAALFLAQRPLFESLSDRTWSKVADEYLDLMRSVGAN